MKAKSKQTQPIKKGDCILKENPFVFVLKSKFRTERCDYCLSGDKVLKCSSCQYVYYCGRECQKKAWLQHKIECPFLKKVFPVIVPDAARILSRIILKLRNNGDLERGYYTDKDYRKFQDLMSHYQDIKDDSKRMEHFESLTHVLRDLLGDIYLPNSVELLGMYGRLVVNGFNILDGEMNPVGTGIYLGVSVTDHSCQPNAVVTFEGTTMFMRALEDLPCLDFTKIFISYIDAMNTTEDRKAELQANYYFMCECPRCLDLGESVDMNLAACPNQFCDNGINLQARLSDSCSKCHATVTEDFRNSYHDITEFTKEQLSNMRDVAYLDVCKICLKKQQQILHPLNIWRTKTLDMAFESAIDIGKWDEALFYGESLIPEFTKYNGRTNPLLGLLYMKIGKIQLYVNKMEEAKTSLMKAEQILKISHGNSHSLYREQLIPLLIQCKS